MAEERRRESNKNQRRMFEREIASINIERVLRASLSLAILAFVVMIFICLLFMNDITSQFVIPCNIFAIGCLIVFGFAYVACSIEAIEYYNLLSLLFIGYIIVFSCYLSLISQRVSGNINFYLLSAIFAGYLIISYLSEYIFIVSLEMVSLAVIVAISLKNGHPLSFIEWTEVLVVHVFSYLLSRELNDMRRELTRQTLKNRKAHNDPLTGLINRRGLAEATKQPYSDAVRKGANVSILMLDIDNFKKYNDGFGHPQGDVCLKEVAECIRRVVGKKGIPSRIGGEEFLVFMYGIRPDEMYRIACDIRANVEALALPQATGPTDVVTVSIGLYIDVPHADMTFEAFYSKADKQLYQAKNTGKNKVVCNKKFKNIG